MIEVHTVSSETAHLYASEMESYFRWRHAIYVGERGWTDLARPDGLERDQFDTDAATHLLALDQGRVVGGSRLIRASEPTILSEVFPDLVERGEVPRDACTLDWTRMFVVPSHRVPRRKLTVRGALFSCVMEHAVATGARQVGGVIETFWLPLLLSMGWHTRILGMPRSIAGSMTVAAFIKVDEEALENVRRTTGWSQSVLVSREPLNRRAA